MKFLIIFFALSVVNVIFATVKSIFTVKDQIWLPAFLSGGYFAFYNVMLQYTVADFPMWEKCVITGLCNIIGVAIVKFIERKMRKDKLWEIKATFRSEFLHNVDNRLNDENISHNYIEDIGKHCMFHIYCETCEETSKVKAIINDYNGKYFATETKLL